MAEEAWPARPAVAGYARPLPHLALGGDAAADPGCGGHSLLRALPAPLSYDRGARLGLRGRGAAPLERPWLLRPGQEPARRSAAHHRARVSPNFGRDC